MNSYGLLGEKLGHSLSPDIHEEIFKKLNIKGSYSLFEVSKDNIDNVIPSIKVLGISGINVTIPYKNEVMKSLDDISKEAQEIGAVNTISVNDGKTIGYNTDYFGFGEMLKRFNINCKNKNIVILGAGGASKAVVQYFYDNGAKNIYLVSRKPETVYKKEFIKVISYEELSKIVDGDIIVNTTPCGMYPNIDSMAINKEILKNYKTAVDIIYNPIETMFLREAKKLGLKTVDGLYMLVGQAIKAEEIWNNTKLKDSDIEEIYMKASKLLEA